MVIELPFWLGVTLWLLGNALLGASSAAWLLIPIIRERVGTTLPLVLAALAAIVNSIIAINVSIHPAGVCPVD